MCFTIDPEYKEPILAKEDIVVYKVCRRCLFAVISPIQMSFYFPFITRGERKLEVIESYGTEDIEVGYHSFSTLKAAKESLYDGRVFKFVIPKGSTYYFNSRESEIVSSRIRLVSLIAQ